ncbi:MAG: CpaF family protein [Oligoflexia bacterium]|nr:CpaF family protein [Oligoflexia bacterium]
MKEQFKNATEEFYYLYSNFDVTEVMINGKNEIFYEEKGKVIKSPMSFSDDKEIVEIIRNLFLEAGKEFTENLETEVVNLPNSKRMAVVLPPISFKGPALVIRKMPIQAHTFDNLISYKSITKEGVEILKKIACSFKGILISGGVGSGKITLANCFTQLIPDNFRVIVLEKVGDMIINKAHYLHLQAKERTSESFIELIKFAGVLRPDVLFVNPIDGPEASHIVNLGRNGHTVHAVIHAEDTIDALKRMELMYLRGDSIPGQIDIRKMINDVFTYTMQLDRFSSGRRVITSINRIDGVDDNGKFIITPLYWYDKENDVHKITNEGEKLI